MSDLEESLEFQSNPLPFANDTDDNENGFGKNEERLREALFNQDREQLTPEWIRILVEKVNPNAFNKYTNWNGPKTNVSFLYWEIETSY